MKLRRLGKVAIKARLRVRRESEPRVAEQREYSVTAKAINPSARYQAIGWNVVVIVVGGIIALFAWAGADLGDISTSVMRQTVAALWMLCGLVGLLIAAVGLLGATLVHTLRYHQ